MDKETRRHVPQFTMLCRPAASRAKEYTQLLNSTCFSSYPSAANACDHLWVADGEADLDVQQGHYSQMSSVQNHGWLVITQVVY
jgi:hypothetical protein